jgi:glycosyltransferase involved in cell wall biosynthesis
MLSRSNGLLASREVVKFPTRIDTNIFKPLDKKESRVKLGLPEGATIVTTTGRLAWWKGWKFMIDSFMLFNQEVKNSIFYIVGEGEDYNKILSYISENKLTEKVFLTGKKGRDQIALYLNASDLYIMGSYKEGWPTALMEAIACGVPACATEFSSVDEIIIDGVNGYITRSRSEEQFSSAMLKSIKLQRPVENSHVTRHSTDMLRADILHYWKLV